MGILLNFLFFLVLLLYIYNKQSKNKSLSAGFMIALMFYHLLFNIIYFLQFGYETDAYVQFYVKGIEAAKMNSIQTSTEFMYQVCYFFHHYLNYSYNDIQVFFAIFTSFGFIKYYEVLKSYDNNATSTSGINILHIILFIPGFHFWLSTAQKDCFVFVGSVCFLRLLVNFQRQRYFSIKNLVLGFLAFTFIALPRPYSLAFIAVAIVLAYVIFNKKTRLIYKIILFGIIIVVFQFALPQLFNVGSLQDLDVETVENTLEKAQRFSVAGSVADSGLGLSGNESMAFKIVAYFYFPLFFNSPNALGLFSSFENLILLILTFILFKNIFKKFKQLLAQKVILLCVLCYIIIIVGMSFISYNIGANARTKVMAYPYFFLAVYGLTRIPPKNKIPLVKASSK